MKTNRPQNFKLVKGVFYAYCEENSLVPHENAVMFEHGGFSCSAKDSYGEDHNFRAVDAACSYCEEGAVDYCFNCGRNYQIDFEEV